MGKRQYMEQKFINGHEYVDLGLPSGTLWATCNVGASSPEEYGDYFDWGETTPKSVYTWDTYKYGSAYNKQTKYCIDSIYGLVDNRAELEPSDDAATVNWGSEWCMPTIIQLDELIRHCIWTWTTLNSVEGMLVVGPNGNTIFLPAAGRRFDSSLFDAGSWDYYWSSSLRPDYQNSAFDLNFSSDDIGRFGDICWFGDSRCLGLSVRPVRILKHSKKHFPQRMGRKCII